MKSLKFGEILQLLDTTYLLLRGKGHFTKVYSNKGCELQNFCGIL